MSIKLKKVSAVLILFVWLLSIASCSGNTETDGITESPIASGDVTTTVEDDGFDVPKSDYEGRVFNVLTQIHAEYEFGSGEETGEIVNDTIYSRNSAVEELLNIKINVNAQPGWWEDRTNFNNLIKNSVLANDGVYDVVSASTATSMILASEQMFLDANTLEYINFEKDWWLSDMDKTLSIKGKLYGFIGDANLSLYKDLSVFYFNKALIERYALDNPYDYVKNGKWTYDIIMEMAKSVEEDLNGDGKIDIDNDVIGYLSHPVCSRATLTATQSKIFDIGDNGVPEYLGLSTRISDVYEKLLPFFADEGNVFVVSNVDTQPEIIQPILTDVFMSDRTLFLVDFLSAAEYLRNMESDFGIVPFPKYDEAQSDYGTQIGTSTTMFFVPVTTPDPELVGKVCEALSYESHKNVVPAYYEVALKEKYTRDADVKEILDIIRRSAVMSFDFAYATYFSPSPNTTMAFENKGKDAVNGNITSYFEKQDKAWTSQLDKLLEAFSVS